jgi:hypothetical protein
VSLDDVERIADVLAVEAMPLERALASQQAS